MQKTLTLTRDQIDLAKIIVEADILSGRTPDPLIARIATVDKAPVIIDGAEILSTTEPLLRAAAHSGGAPSTPS